MSEASLEDVLNGTDEVEEAEVSEDAEIIADDAEETTVDEPSQEAEPDAPTATDKAPEKEAEQEWTFHAVKDEREKRQAAEKRAKELEQQLQQSKEQPEQKIDLFEDPEGFVKSLKDEFKFELANERAELSEEMLREAHDDVDEKLEIFDGLSAVDPTLLAKVQSSRRPWHEMYKIASNHEKLKKLEDVDAYEAEVRAEIEAKVRAELEGKVKKDEEKRESITPSLASKRSSGGHKNPTDQSLEDILGR